MKHYYEIFTFSWALKQLAIQNRDEQYDRLLVYWQDLAKMTALLLTISAEMYHEGQAYFLSWDHIPTGGWFWNRVGDLPPSPDLDPQF